MSEKSGSNLNLTSFVLGALTIVAILAGIYYFQKLNVENPYQPKDGETRVKPMLPLPDEKMPGAESSEDADLENINPSQEETTLIKGKLCYPSSYLPTGEVAIKNLTTNEIEYLPVDGTNSNYEYSVTPGKYTLRYQAHADGNNPQVYTSGYYTMCGTNNSYENCQHPNAHKPFTVEAKSGEIVTNVDLCDFYYTTEPEF